MKIYKKLNTDFTVTSNEIFRHGLSLKAIGLYLYIVNKPDGWSFSLEGVASQTADGIDSVRAGVRELERAGFLVRLQERDTSGKMRAGSWSVTDKPLGKPTKKQGKPLEKPTSGNPTSVYPTSGKPLQVSTKEVNTKEQVSTKNSTSLNGAVAPAGGIKKDNSVLNGHHLGGSSGGGKAKPQGYGNPDVNELIAYLMERSGLPVLNGTKDGNRRYAYLALKKFGSLEKCKLVVDAAMQSTFWHTKLVSTKDLYYQGVKIVSDSRNREGGVISVKR